MARENDSEREKGEGWGEIAMSDADREAMCVMLSERMGRSVPVGAEGSAFLRSVELWLVERFREMLAQRAEQAFQALYRVDVAEADVKEVMARQAVGAWPEAFARLVLVRQVEKAATRQRWQAQFAPSKEGDCS